MKVIIAFLLLTFSSCLVSAEPSAAFKSYVQHDYIEARRLYELDADNGDERAPLFLATIYKLGLGVPKDESVAALWLKFGASRGYPSAQSELGLAYEQGIGVPKDIVKAYLWFKLSFIKGDSDAKKAIDRVSQLMSEDQLTYAENLVQKCPLGFCAFDHRVINPREEVAHHFNKSDEPELNKPTTTSKSTSKPFFDVQYLQTKPPPMPESPLLTVKPSTFEITLLQISVAGFAMVFGFLTANRASSTWLLAGGFVLSVLFSWIGGSILWTFLFANSTPTQQLTFGLAKSFLFAPFGSSLGVYLSRRKRMPLT